MSYVLNLFKTFFNPDVDYILKLKKANVLTRPGKSLLLFNLSMNGLAK